MSKPTASFNAIDLAGAVPGLIVVGTKPLRFPNRVLSTAPVANTDLSVTSSSFYADKKVNVHVEIGRDTRELLDNALDILNSILQNPESALICSVGTGSRQWTATLANITENDLQGGWGDYDIEFECSTPLGQDAVSTQLFSNNLSGSSNTVNFTVFGSALWQQPQITITYSALTGGTAKTVTVGNSATGQTVTITRTWTTGEVLVIDSINKKVTVNGTEVPFTGAIPEWQGSTSGVAGSMDYTDTLTTRTRSSVGLYFKRYV